MPKYNTKQHKRVYSSGFWAGVRKGIQLERAGLLTARKAIGQTIEFEKRGLDILAEPFRPPTRKKKKK